VFSYCYQSYQAGETGIVDEEEIGDGTETLKGAIEYVLETAWDGINDNDFYVIYRFDRIVAFISFIPSHMSSKITFYPTVAVVHVPEYSILAELDPNETVYTAESMGYPEYG